MIETQNPEGELSPGDPSASPPTNESPSVSKPPPFSSPGQLQNPLLPSAAELVIPEELDSSSVAEVHQPAGTKPRIVVVEDAHYREALDFVDGLSSGQALSVVGDSHKEQVSYLFAGSREGHFPNIAASLSECQLPLCTAESRHTTAPDVAAENRDSAAAIDVVTESKERKVSNVVVVVEPSHGHTSIDNGRNGGGQAFDVGNDAREENVSVVAPNREEIDSIVVSSQIEGQVPTLVADTSDGQQEVSEEQAEIMAAGLEDGQASDAAAEDQAAVVVAESTLPAESVAAGSIGGESAIALAEMSDVPPLTTDRMLNEEQGTIVAVGESQAPTINTNEQVPGILFESREGQTAFVIVETRETQGRNAVIESTQITDVAANGGDQASNMVGESIEAPHVVVNARQIPKFAVGSRGGPAPSVAAGMRESESPHVSGEAGATQAPSVIAGPREGIAQNTVSGNQAPYVVIVQGLGRQVPNAAAGSREGQATNVVAGTRVVVEAKGLGELEPSEEATKLPVTKRRKITLRGQWTNDTLQEAISAVRRGAMTLRQAGRHYNIPPSSLSEHMTGRITKRKYGPQGVLSVEEEASIVNWVRQTLADGWPVGIKQLKMKVAEVTRGRPTPFTKGIPGSSWLRLFKNRHPDLMIGMPVVRQNKSYSLPSTLALSCFYTYQSLSSFSSIEDYVCWIQERSRRKSSTRSSFPTLPPPHNSANVDGLTDADSSAPYSLPYVFQLEDSQVPSDVQPQGTELSNVSQPTDSQPSANTGEQVSKRKRSIERGQWTSDALEKAIVAVNGGYMSMRRAARMYNIPPSSLSDHIKGKVGKRKPGLQDVLSEEEEELLVKWAIKTQGEGHPLTIQQLKLKVAELTKTKDTTTGGHSPGASWWKLFKARHPELSIERAEKGSISKPSAPLLPAPEGHSQNGEQLLCSQLAAPPHTQSAEYPSVLKPSARYPFQIAQLTDHQLPDAVVESGDMQVPDVVLPSKSQPSGARKLQVSKKRKRTERGQWTSDTLAEAIAAIKSEGMSLRQAARFYNIPASSLFDHMTGRITKRKYGPQGVLSDEEEASVVKWVLKMKEDGQSVSVQQLKLKVAEITQSRPTPFTKGIPGDSWWNLFKRRHPDLSIGVTEGILNSNCSLSTVPNHTTTPLNVQPPMDSQFSNDENPNYFQQSIEDPTYALPSETCSSPNGSHLTNFQPSGAVKSQHSKRRTGQRGQWTNDALAEAIAAVKQGVMNMRQSARFYNIPPSSLSDHLKGKITKRKYGPQGVLSDSEEKLVVEWLLQKQEEGVAVSIRQLKLKVAEITKTRQTPFTKGIPGPTWWKLFKARHPDLSICSSEGRSNPKLYICVTPPIPASPSHSAGQIPSDSQLLDIEHPADSQAFQPSALSVCQAVGLQLSAPHMSNVDQLTDTHTPNIFQLTGPETPNDEQPMDSEPSAHTNLQVGKRKGMTKTGQWTSDSLAKAIMAVKRGIMGLRQAARAHNIPPSSLYDHLTGKIKKRKRGPQGVLSQEEEALVVEWILKTQEEGHSVTIQQLKLKVAEITQSRPTPFTKGIPGPTWWKLFKARHPDLMIVPEVRVYKS
ncbi:unnamed protein product [Sphagnum jensenii]|uniref:HTH CENPB-type domain-containing protein n=1 Tax=Sphagnum jensenii TaxID=128206 RepID=A0ABP1AG99_9BRYO